MEVLALAAEFQPCEIQDTEKDAEQLGEESLSSMFPGQREPKALLCPPNKASVGITHHSCPVLIAPGPKTELRQQCLHAERRGWPSLGAGASFDGLVPFDPAL